MGSQETMAAAEETPIQPPHVLMFPLPLLGHVTSMLKLAQLLCVSGLHVTVLLSENDHRRLLGLPGFKSHFGLQFATIPDGLPEDHPRAGEAAMDIVMSLKVNGESEFRNLMVSTDRLSRNNESKRRPVTCMIQDAVLSFASRVSDEMGIPYIYFWTAGACSFWVFFSTQEIIDANELPVKGKSGDKASHPKRKEMDSLVTSVPGMEQFLRRRDLPSLFRVDDANDPSLQTLKTETRNSTKARALIFNTYEDLEGPILDQIRKHVPALFSIAPLHGHLKTRIAENSSRKHSGSYWEEDRSCMDWLDTQPHKSVIYVSFGGVAFLTRDELLEFWYGLVNSGHRFLWVTRPDLVIGENGKSRIPIEVEEGTSARGYIVKWAPQEEVLAHPAVGGFLTHSGWNSTLESLFAGMPMICWPYFADQMINSRFVSQVWKVGLDMKDSCDRVTVENMVRELMEVRKDEFLNRADHMANLARRSICDGGSSYANLNRLIEFIRSMVM